MGPNFYFLCFRVLFSSHTHTSDAIPCRSWRKYCSAHVQDPHAHWGINVGDGVVLLKRETGTLDPKGWEEL